MPDLGVGQLTKTFSNTYLYNKANHEKFIFDYLMNATEINKLDPSFEDIRYDVKRRQVSSSLVKILDSKGVILLTHNTPLPKAFKIITAKDVKGDNKLKVFIDCSDLIKNINGKYVCNNIDILVAYLASAMNQYIYYIDPKRLLMREEIIKNGAACFSTMFTNIVDYLHKVSTIQSTRDKCLYLSSVYYLVNILKKDFNDNTKHIAREISGLSEREEELLIIQLSEHAFDNINYFVDECNSILKIGKLTLDLFIEKWIYLYGVGTHFALELYPSFATVLINAFVGCYLNNQKTIEKITGRDMVAFVNAILRVGGESV